MCTNYTLYSGNKVRLMGMGYQHSVKSALGQKPLLTSQLANLMAQAGWITKWRRESRHSSHQPTTNQVAMFPSESSRDL